MATLLQDLRYAARTLRNSPGFSVIAIVALALGIAANTAIFSLVNASLLRPLPFKEPDRLVTVRERIPKLMPKPVPVPAPDVLDIQNQNRVFESAGAFTSQQMDFSGTGEPRRIRAARITAGLFPTLGVSPQAGRVFTTEEDRPNRRLAILSNDFWRSAFGADHGIIGRTIQLDRKPYVVIGVMPQHFELPIQGMQFASPPAHVWLPMGFTKGELEAKGDNFNYTVLARLKPGITIQQASADMNRVAARIQETFPADVRNEFTLEGIAIPLHEEVAGDTRALLL